MKKYVFLGKDNSEGRDCVKYISTNPLRFECNHYFGGINITGACFSTSLECENWRYGEITTILSEKEFNQLIQFDNNIKTLGFGVKVNDERYLKGLELCKNIQPIFDKLNGDENNKLFERIIEDEKDWLKNEYDLSDNDITAIFNSYDLDYKDRGIVSYIYDDIEDLAYEEAISRGYVQPNDYKNKYFNFELFGDDLLDNNNYLKISDGRIVYLNY